MSLGFISRFRHSRIPCLISLLWKTTVDVVLCILLFGLFTYARADQPKYDLKIGDKFQIELMTHVNASFVGTPYPSLWKVVSRAKMPDSEINIEARIIAAVYGDPEDEGAHFYPVEINIREDSGRKVYRISGTILNVNNSEVFKGELIQSENGHCGPKWKKPLADKFDKLKRQPVVKEFETYCEVSILDMHQATLIISDIKLKKTDSQQIDFSPVF